MDYFKLLLLKAVTAGKQETAFLQFFIRFGTIFTSIRCIFSKLLVKKIKLIILLTELDIHLKTQSHAFILYTFQSTLSLFQTQDYCKI